MTNKLAGVKAAVLPSAMTARAEDLQLAEAFLLAGRVQANCQPVPSLEEWLLANDKVQQISPAKAKGINSIPSFIVTKPGRQAAWLAAANELTGTLPKVLQPFHEHREGEPLWAIKPAMGGGKAGFAFGAATELWSLAKQHKAHAWIVQPYLPEVAKSEYRVLLSGERKAQ